MPKGGKREGAGRPKTEPSKTMRIPEGLVPIVEQLLKEYKERKKET